MSRERVRWQAARRHLTLAAEGGLLLPGQEPQTFRTAPLPDGTPPKLWENCECDYLPPQADGKPVPHKADPAWSQWGEEPSRSPNGKQSLRLALTRAPKGGDPGGLLGPNFYRLGHFHSGDARREQPGFPDLLIWSARGREVWELKKMGDVPTLPQAVHMTALELLAGFTVRLVRPCCLLSGSVDRWLADLAGVEPTLSAWAPRPRRPSLPADPPVRLVPTSRPASKMEIISPRRTGRLQLVPPPPPGRDLGPLEADTVGQAVGYVVPLPVDDETRRLGAIVEAWLREHGFPASDVPWPLRFAVTPLLLVVWANSGEPAPGPGQGRPRKWRVGTLHSAVPEQALQALHADMVGAPSLAKALPFIQHLTPSVNIS